MIPESASPPVFVPPTRNSKVTLEVGCVKPWLKRWGQPLLQMVPVVLLMSPPQHRVVVGIRLDLDVEDLSHTLGLIFH